MTRNPLFRNYKSVLAYIGCWILISGIQMLTLCLAKELSFGYAIADTLAFNIFFAACLIPVWYPVRFNGWERKTWQFNITTHLSLSTIFVAVCLSGGYFLMWLGASDNSEYVQFLNISHWWKILEGYSVYFVMVLIYYLFVYIERLNEKVSNETRLIQLIKDSELNLLKSQINPHFLFNSLNSINSSIIKNPEQAQKMLVALSDYLRYAVLANNKIYSSLQDEIDNIERYLSIEKLRFGDKLIYESAIHADCLLLKLPAMLLQPLFENAIKHGVYESLERVKVDVEATHNTKYLTIVISNDYDTENVSQKKGSGTGLKNIQERLRLSYNTDASLHTKFDRGKFIATLKIPILL